MVKRVTAHAVVRFYQRFIGQEIDISKLTTEQYRKALKFIQGVSGSWRLMETTKSGYKYRYENMVFVVSQDQKTVITIIYFRPPGQRRIRTKSRG